MENNIPERGIVIIDKSINKNKTMSKTVMQSHLEWLKRRCLITPQVEAELLADEKQQMLDAVLFNVTKNPKFRILFENQFEQYYNLKFKDNEKQPRGICG